MREFGGGGCGGGSVDGDGDGVKGGLRVGAYECCGEMQVVNGPEILNKFVGESEKNIRDLFADAEKDQKEHGEEPLWQHEGVIREGHIRAGFRMRQVLPHQNDQSKRGRERKGEVWSDVVGVSCAGDESELHIIIFDEIDAICKVCLLVPYLP